MSSLIVSSNASRLASVEKFFAVDVANFKRQLAELDSQIDPNAEPQRNDEYHDRMLKALVASQDACRRFEEQHQDAPDVILDVQEGFRKETDPWFDRSWFSHRARTKPSGFAGDYEMLLKLYEQKTPALGLGGYIDLCLVDVPLAQAVRTRLLAARAFLIEEIESRNEDVRILDIACGPCREYHDWPFSGTDRRVEIVAMDNDQNALDYVDKHVTGHLRGLDQLQTVRYNALRTRSASGNKRKFGTFDIIYSVGLCDYLSDEHLIGMLSAWRETLNPGGVLCVAFKDCERYDKTPYQWHLDWFFFQRTHEDVLSLYERAGFDMRNIETTRDETGIIMNFFTRRSPAAFHRTDGSADSVQRGAGRVLNNSPHVQSD